MNSLPPGSISKEARKKLFQICASLMSAATEYKASSQLSEAGVVGLFGREEGWRLEPGNQVNDALHVPHLGARVARLSTRRNKLMVSMAYIRHRTVRLFLCSLDALDDDINRLDAPCGLLRNLALDLRMNDVADLALQQGHDLVCESLFLEPPLCSA